MAPNLLLSAVLTACLLAVVFGPLSSAGADTLYLKDKKVLKGIIVAEQADRYLVSTVDGEIPVLKASVERIRLDEPEQAYYYLGRQLQQAGRLQEALKAYERAVELRPEFQAAREAAFAIQRKLWRQDEAQVREELSRKQMIRQRASGRSAPSLVDRFGCGLGYAEGWTTVAAVEPGSPAALAGLQVDDLILAVDGEPVTHAEPDEISRRLSAASGDVGLTIERIVRLSRRASGRDPWGLRLAVGYEGLRVAEVAPAGAAAGYLMPGDLVMAIHGQPTRYLPLQDAQRLLQQAIDLEITLQRTAILHERPAS